MTQVEQKIFQTFLAQDFFEHSKGDTLFLDFIQKVFWIFYWEGVSLGSTHNHIHSPIHPVIIYVLESPALLSFSPAKTLLAILMKCLFLPLLSILIKCSFLKDSSWLTSTTLEETSTFKAMSFRRRNAKTAKKSWRSVSRFLFLFSHRTVINSQFLVGFSYSLDGYL